MCAEVPVTAQPLMAKASGRTSSPDRGNTQSITRDSCTALTHQRRPARPAPLPIRPTVLRDGGRSLQQAGQQAGCEPQQSCPWAPLPGAAAGSRGGRMRRAGASTSHHPQHHLHRDTRVLAGAGGDTAPRQHEGSGTFSPGPSMLRPAHGAGTHRDRSAQPGRADDEQQPRGRAERVTANPCDLVTLWSRC